ncbi:hypothetical protein N7449_012154 [Penicillium cf. viridicatum]|uniref:HNH nuclease domain-containing protein n=1 Tax=Penicillium cf. viridicatum TaxID=2972119 RepID=A0A9W9IQD4_9EURO|nr:hypothetical protein N7449_012154 [Penicillium cf. viridicatum]
MPLNNDRLETGDYNISSSSGAVVRSSDERFIRRIQSRDRGTPRQDSFRRAVRARDQKCVITGIENSEAEVDNWEGFEAAHIFPLEREALWKQCNFNQFITLPARHPMNSVQNGLLLTSSVHQKFDSYAISVNPDDGYKITDFRGDVFSVDGRILDPVCRDPSNLAHVADELLRWHFRQAVLGNMRGAGEPVFEHDFPPGSDMMGEIMEGPFAAEHMELELFSRLRTVPSESEDSVY